MMNRQAGVATATNYYHQHQPHLQHQHHPPYQPPHYHEPAPASLAYRPLPLPLLQQPLHLRHQQPTPSTAEQQTQLSLAAVGAGFQHPNFRPHQPTTIPHRSRQQSRQEQQRAMAYDQGHSMTDDELAQLQQASNEYEAPITGPLVGQRQPSTALITEYASADPVYQAKTQVLARKYSYLRKVRGDGKCGWRAVAFGYFEALINHGDSNQFGVEEARLRSLHPTLIQGGFPADLFEDFSDETYGLLREISNALNEGLDANVILLESFNDDMAQNYIITHLRTLTAAWMRTREAEYSPWLLGQTVQKFTDDQVLPVAAEMDHVALMALKDVLVSPAGIFLELSYLDRSEGSEATMHRYDPVNTSYTIGNVILLYRPGHYDLLYKPEHIPAPPRAPLAVPTYLQFESQTHQEPVYDLGVSAMPECLMSIPGMSYANQSQAWGLPSSYGSAPEFSFATQASVPTCTPAVPTPTAPAPQPYVQSQSAFVPTSTPTQMLPPPTQLTHDLMGGGPFRPSAWQLEPDFVHATSNMPLQTSIFRNSHFNTAHFLNPAFQPEQWDPEGEYTTATCTSKSSRHKSSG